MSTLFEILRGNVALLADEDIDAIVTVNDKCFRVWHQLERGAFQCAFEQSCLLVLGHGYNEAPLSTLESAAHKLLQEFKSLAD